MSLVLFVQKIVKYLYTWFLFHNKANKMEMQLILAACIVNFGLTPVQLHFQMADKTIARNVNDESRIQETFQNLFDSVVTNNTRDSEKYRKILNEEVRRELKVFRSMKENIKMAQNRNPDKNRNLNKRMAKYVPEYEQVKDKLEDMFVKIHGPNVNEMYELDWELADHLTEEWLEKACMDVAKAITPQFLINQTNYIPPPGLELSLQMEKVIRYAPVKFKKMDEMKYMTLINCTFQEIDFFIGQGPDDNHVFAFHKDRIDNIYYFRSGLHLIHYK